MAMEEIPLDRIETDPDQPRKDFARESLDSLGQSLLKGQLVAIIVVLMGTMYRLVDGERRVQAARLAGLKTLRAEVLTAMPDPADLRVMQIVVNTQRRGLSPVELLRSVEELIQSHGLTPTQVAERLSLPKSKITETLALRKLPDWALNLVGTGELPASSAYTITRMSEEKQQDALSRVQEGRLTRDDAKLMLSHRKRSPAAEVRQKTIVLQLSNAAIRVSAAESLDLNELVEVLSSATKDLKRSLRQGLDVKTASLVLRDQSQNNSAVEPRS
jgi:ParB family chromosome partitioning protein